MIQISAKIKDDVKNINKPEIVRDEQNLQTLI